MAASSGDGAVVAAQIPDGEFITLNDGEAGRQWLAHSQTGEVRWLPGPPEGTSAPWQLAFNARGLAYLWRRCGDLPPETLAANRILKVTLHEAPSGRRYVFNSTTKKSKWLDELKAEFAVHGVEFADESSRYMCELWRLTISQGGCSIYWSFKLLFHWFNEGSSNTEVYKKMKSAVKWLAVKLIKFGLPEHLRWPRRGADQAGEGDLKERTFGGYGVSTAAIMIFFAYCIQHDGIVVTKKFKAFSAMAKFILAGIDLEFTYPECATKIELDGSSVLMSGIRKVIEAGGHHASFCKLLVKECPGDCEATLIL